MKVYLSELVLLVLRLEELRGGVPRVSLGVVELSCEVVSLLLPLVDRLVEALLLLLQRRGEGVRALDIDLWILLSNVYQ